MTCSKTIGCRSVGTRMPRPGEPRIASMKFQAPATFHGRRMTRGCVVTRRNSYKIDHVVYQASARARWRSNQSR
jgi:hypothetical protein